MSKKKQAPAPPAQKTPAQEVADQAVIPEKILLGGCLILTFVIFANTLGAGFVNWDDHGYLWLNRLVQPLSGAALAEMFRSHTCGNYSPLVVLTYCIEHGWDRIVQPGAQVVENFQPFKYHLTNVLLHLGTTAMAFFLFRSLGLRSWALALATALFGIHPLRSESVAWVTERKDVLYGFFYLAALFCYQQYLSRTDKKTLFYGLTLGLGLLSFFSKIQAVSLPLSMLALDYFAGRDLKKVSVWLEKLPFFTLSLIFGLVGLHFLDAAEGLKDSGYPLTDRFFFATYSLCHYVVKLVLPFGLSAYYPYPQLGAPPAIYYATPLVLAGMGWLVWQSTRRTKVIAFGAAFFLLNIMFVLQFKGAGKAFLADRFTYIPYFGLFFILAKYYQDITEGHLKTGLKNALPWVAAAFVVLCAGLTFLQNKTWHSSVALWENVTAQHPDDALSWCNKGLAHYDEKDWDKSIQAYERALQADANYYDAAHNLGVSLHQQKRYDEAIQAFTRAITSNPESPDGYLSRGQEYATTKDYAKAIADYEKAKSLGLKKPDHELNFLLGVAYSGLNQHEKALAVFDAAARESPAQADYCYQKGNAHAALGRMAEAVAQYDVALRINPAHVDALNNKGNALAAQSKFPEAAAAFDAALKAAPSAANTYFNRGMVRNSLGDKLGACADWQKAAQLGYTQAQAVLVQLCR